MDDILSPMSAVPGFLEPDNLMGPMLEGIVDAMPCFSSMRALATADGENPLGAVRNGAFRFPSGAEPGNKEGVLITRLRSAGVPLKGDAFPPFAYMAGGDARLLPSVTVLLEARDTWLLIEEGGEGHARTCLIYAWEGGKAHYTRHPTDVAILKTMVDGEALKAKAAASPRQTPTPTPSPPPPSSKIELAVIAAKAAKVAAVVVAPPSNTLQRLRDSGFHPIGTEDMGPALQIQSDDGSTLVVCRGDGPSLAKSRSFLIRKYRDGLLEAEQPDMDVDAILETIRPIPAALKN